MPDRSTTKFLPEEPWVLVVDKSEEDADVVVRMIQSQQRPEQVFRCNRAEEAAELIRHKKRAPSLVLVDENLVGMTALELLATIRSSGRSILTPVVFLSDANDAQLVAAALEAGANSYICKSSDLERMKSEIDLTLRYWLEIHCSPTSSRVWRDDWRLR